MFACFASPEESNMDMTTEKKPKWRTNIHKSTSETYSRIKRKERRRGETQREQEERKEGIIRLTHLPLCGSRYTQRSATLHHSH
eukprot:1255938-Amorphochlora_amoeboformis.AAC.1